MKSVMVTRCVLVVCIILIITLWVRCAVFQTEKCVPEVSATVVGGRINTVGGVYGGIEATKSHFPIGKTHNQSYVALCGVQSRINPSVT